SLVCRCELEYLVRFLVGGIAVSLFAVIGDVLRPKSFAGLFGAAPSIAIATLALTVAKEGNAYAATETRSTILGAVALCLYSIVVCQLLKRYRLNALLASAVSMVVWLIAALGFARLILGGRDACSHQA